MDSPTVPPPDAETLSEGWRIAGAAPAPGRWPAWRLLYAIRRLLAALLRPQESFNAAVVRRLDALAHESRAHTADARQVAQKAVDKAVDAIATAHHAVATAGNATTAARDAAATSAGALEHSQRIREAFGARERRTEEALTAVLDAQQELRTTVGVLQHATQSLKRELGRQGASPAPGAGAPPASAPISDALDSHRYVGFEDRFRGTTEEIRERLVDYPPLFAGTSDVLDLGCGRGEFLALLQDQGVTARGIDVNQSMVEVCQDRGLEAEVGDALGYLAGLPDASLGGLFSAQVVEHLEPGYLARLLDTAFDKLRPSAPIVLETINPACWFAFFDSYIRDLSHVRPIHPETLQYLLVASGFQQVEIQYRMPYPEHQKLQALPADAAPELTDLADTFNANVTRLNGLLFTWLDYAIIGRRA